MKTPSRRLLLSVAVAMLVVVAGCSGGGESQTADDTWSEGDSYTYSTNGSDRTFSWTVDEVDGEAMTATVAIGDNSTRYRAPVSAPFEDIQDNVESRFDAIIVAPFAVLYNYQALFVGDNSLEAGNSWTVEPPQAEPGSGMFGGGQAPSGVTPGEAEPLTVEVTGTDTVAGVECTTIVATPESGGEGDISMCVKADWPFPLSVSGGESGQGFELTEYER